MVRSLTKTRVALMTSTSTDTFAATEAFYTTDGKIIGPTGTPFVARGVDVIEGNQPSASTLQADFPGINFVRFAIYDNASPTTLASYVNQLTSAGIVVELEDHSNSNGSNAGGSQGVIFTGTELTTELNWYSSIGSAFKSNPDVWFGTDNEPSETDSSGNNDPAALSTWQQETYDAVRDTGNTNPILVEMNSYSVASTGQGYTASDYASMTNIVWDIHYYGWVSGYSTDQTIVTNTLTGMVAQAQTITSANGTVPALIGEYGNSTNGSTLDANGNQVITAVESSGLGSAAWAWAYNPTGSDSLLNSDGSLSSFGEEVAAGIAAAAAKALTTTGSTVPVKPSANDTTLVSGATGSITDASGNKWTIVNGGVDENGTAAGYSSGVVEIAYVNGAIWQENASKLWWSWTGSAWSSGSGTSTSPLPAPPAVTPSANNTTLLAGATGSITDASGNKWTIVNGVVDENGKAAGVTSSVAELAYVKGVVWRESTSKLWWSWSGTAWSTGNGTATSPLPVVPSPNDTVLAASSTAAITDASGNKWTIVKGIVDKNGVAAGYSSGVVELAYVNGVIWQENASDLWWSWTGTAWSSTNGTSTSPLPA